MKLFGKKKQNIKDGYKEVLYILGLPVIKKRKDLRKKETFLLGIKIKSKKINSLNALANQQTGTKGESEFIIELMTKALEANLRDMKRFQRETEERLNKLEKALNK